MVDSFIATNPASPNPGTANVETSSLTSVAGVTVQRERVAVGDPVNVGSLAQVGPRGLQVDSGAFDMLREVLIELRVHTMMLAIGLNITDDLDALRADAAQQAGNPNLQS